ncbi:VOC family protein [Cellulomonas carbonis]|uniref:Glyoxalase n=1 Tax=Cellulomonas carbonis T26 TaxID=947969 RepID=A0A0A0BUN7_9CELL|nr:VOC family protein [Cellulomonas carbonis]KGM11631.1 glyoxalase [Cellulomonas carbonis T26]GGC03112.1 glyoxalase [Cellulomonas carbonis]
MLSDHAAMPVVAVSDVDRARRFYEETLGLTPASDIPDGLLFRAGGVQLLVYRSEYAGTNKATAVSFDVPEGSFDAEVADLRGRGVTFQEYDLEGVTWSDGVASMDGMRAAWFEDPDGNILNISTSTAS